MKGSRGSINEKNNRWKGGTHTRWTWTRACVVLGRTKYRVGHLVCAPPRFSPHGARKHGSLARRNGCLLALKLCCAAHSRNSCCAGLPQRGNGASCSRLPVPATCAVWTGLDKRRLVASGNPATNTAALGSACPHAPPDLCRNHHPWQGERAKQHLRSSAGALLLPALRLAVQAVKLTSQLRAICTAQNKNNAERLRRSRSV